MKVGTLGPAGVREVREDEGHPHEGSGTSIRPVEGTAQGELDSVMKDGGSKSKVEHLVSLIEDARKRADKKRKLNWGRKQDRALASYLRIMSFEDQLRQRGTNLDKTL